MGKPILLATQGYSDQIRSRLNERRRNCEKKRLAGKVKIWLNKNENERNGVPFPTLPFYTKQKNAGDGGVLVHGGFVFFVESEYRNQTVFSMHRGVLYRRSWTHETNARKKPAVIRLMCFLFAFNLSVGQ